MAFRLSFIIIILLLILLSPTYAQKTKLIEPIGHTASIKAVAFSPDGRYVISGARDYSIKLWEVSSGRLIHTFEGHKSTVTSVAYSPDGRFIVSGSWDKTLKLWDVCNGRVVRTLTGHQGYVNSLAISPDGRSIISGSDDIKLWDFSSGRLLYTFGGHTGGVNSLAISPDGRFVVVGGDGNTLVLWDISNRRLMHSFEGNREGTSSVAFSPDSRFVVTGEWNHNTLKLWETSSGRLVKAFKGFTSGVSSLAFSPDGRSVASGSNDRRASLWNVISGQLINTLEGHRDDVSSVAFSPDGRFVISGSRDKTLKLWDSRNSQLVRTFYDHSIGVRAIAISSDDRKMVCASSDKTAKLWDFTRGQLVRAFAGHTGSVNSVAFSADGRSMVSGSGDRTMKLWSVHTGELIRTFEKHVDGVYSVAILPDGRYALSGSDTLQLWNVSTGQLSRTFEGKSPLALSLDGCSLVTRSNKSLKLWDVSNGQLIRTLEGNKGSVNCLAFSPNGQTVVSTSDMHLKLWDVSSGQLIRTFEGHKGLVNSVAFSPDGRSIVSASNDNTLKLWNISSGQLLQTFERHTDWVTSVAMAPDGRFIISSSSDNTIKIWKAQTSKEIATLIAVDSTDWVVTTPDGLFDASPGAMKLMHYVVNDSNDHQEPWKIIELDNLKQRYYQPGLLPILMGFSKETLRQVPAFEGVALPPALSLTVQDHKLQVQLQNRKGGIGAVVVSLNGAEVISDLRPNPAQDSTRSTLTLSLDLSLYARRLDTLNQISVVVYNAEGWIRSRPQTVTYRPDAQARGGLVGGVVTPGGSEPVQLRAVVVGTSNVGLRFAHYDAEQIANGLRLSAGELLGAANVQVQLFSSLESDVQPVSAPAAGTQATRTPGSRVELIKALQAGQSLRPQDVFVLYLAGHGVNYGGVDGDFYYLTAGATSSDAEYLKDPAIRQQYALSSNELAGYLNQIPARKKLLILDVCAAGRGAEQVMLASRDVPASQIRALDRLQERTGFYVLAGSAANAVSYEANVYGQGLLTYALLKGMKGASVRQEGINKFLDVERWLGYAVEQVPQLARGVGGIQQPFYRGGTGANLPGQETRSFDIGKITEPVQRQIRLTEPKPVLQVESFQDSALMGDVLDLGNQIRTVLIDLSARGAEAPVVYLEASDYPGAYAISGRYSVQGETVTVNCVVFQGEKQAGAFAVSGSKTNLSTLAGQILTRARAVAKH